VYQGGGHVATGADTFVGWQAAAAVAYAPRR